MASAAAEDGAPFTASGGDGRQHFVPVGPGDHGSHFGGGVGRVSDAHAGDLGYHGVPEPLVDRVLDQDARPAQADLPLVGKGCANGGVQGFVEIGIVEDHGGVLASELEGQLLEFRGGGSGDGGAGG